MRQKTELEITLRAGARGEARSAGAEGTEARAATTEVESRAAGWPSMEAIVERDNLRKALAQVKRNKGAAGVDGMSLGALAPYLKEHWPTIRAQLLDGTYKPQPVRRVEIPKASGGQRPLGIPTVLDRFIQQAMLQVLQADWDRTFSEHSYGFRPKRSAHQAVTRAQEMIAASHDVVVDIDLEKFFDRVPHQRLLAKLRRTIRDERIVRMVRQMLRAGVVMPDGVVIATEEGTPQGGPLSPVLSNIVLDELDHELERRGHRFVRYADDLSIYVKSERGGQRVFESVARFLEQRMKLVVNRQKSAVSRPRGRHILGFSIRPNMRKKQVELDISERTKTRLRERIRELTPRNHGRSLREAIRSINVYLRGWAEYFGVAVWVVGAARYADGHIRRRLRAILLQHWNRTKTIRRKLTGLGAPIGLVERGVGASQGPWRQSNMKVIKMGLRNEYFEERGLLSLEALCAQRFKKGLPLPEPVP